MTAPLRPRRKFSGWTLLAPAALIVLVMLVANAVGSSGIFDDDAPSKKTANTKATAITTPTSAATTKKKGACTAPTGDKTVRVKSGQTLSDIADANCMSVEKLLELNPTITDAQTLQLDQKIVVATTVETTTGTDTTGDDATADSGQ
jgi:LysM repeat protein